LNAEIACPPLPCRPKPYDPVHTPHIGEGTDVMYLQRCAGWRSAENVLAFLNPEPIRNIGAAKGK
jgi:hypothetical protein